MIEIINKDKNLFWDSQRQTLCIFDHIRYDRSDADIISKPQRQYLEKRLFDYGYQWSTARKLISSKHPQIFIIPKQQILGANPQDILRHEKISKQDVFVLTPTQYAAIRLTEDTLSQAVIDLKEMIVKMPINLKKIRNYLRFEPQKNEIFRVLSELETFQNEEVLKESLKNKVHLGKF